MKPLSTDAFRFIEDDSLLITRYGIKVGKSGECLVVKEKDKVLAEIPLFRIRNLTLASDGIGLSSDILRAVAEAEIEVLFVDGIGRPYGSFISTAHLRAARLRRCQYRAADDHRGAHLARAFALAKIVNQGRLLAYYQRNANLSGLPDAIAGIEREAAAVEKLAGNTAAEIQLSVMGHEGTAARIYWQAVMLLLKGKIDFAGRTGRGAVDPVNACLNYGYAILYGECWCALLRSGLDPFAGFLHRDRDGSPSLVHDFAEEFRQPLVDRAIISNLRRGWQPEQDEEGALTLPTRKRIIEMVKENLERENYAVARLISMQARALARYVGGDGGYAPLTDRWW